VKEYPPLSALKSALIRGERMNHHEKIKNISQGLVVYLFKNKKLLSATKDLEIIKTL
jgi:hypothetical protein